MASCQTQSKNTRTPRLWPESDSRGQPGSAVLWRPKIILLLDMSSGARNGEKRDTGLDLNT